MRFARRAVGAEETDRDAAVLARDVEHSLITGEPHRTAGLALHGPAVHLTGNPPLALTQHVIDRSTDRREPPRDFALRRWRRKPLRKFLGNEPGREFSLAPARMIHQRREKGNV